MMNSGFVLDVGLPVQSFDRGHFVTTVWDLDVVTDEYQPSVDAQRPPDQVQHQLGPQSCKVVEFDGDAVEVIGEWHCDGGR